MGISLIVIKEKAGDCHEPNGSRNDRMFFFYCKVSKKLKTGNFFVAQFYKRLLKAVSGY